MDKATPTPSPSVENVMSLAFELARIREKHGAQSDVYLSEVRALRAEVERLAQAAPTDTEMVLVPPWKGYALLGTGNYILNSSAAPPDPKLGAEFFITFATDADKSGNRQVGETRANDPNAAPVQPEEMVLRIGFLTPQALDALEGQLRVLREENFPESVAAQPSLAPVVQAEEYPPLPDSLLRLDGPIWPLICKWDGMTPGLEAGRVAQKIDAAILDAMRAYVDADRASRGVLPAAALTTEQITAGLAAANMAESTFDFGDGSTAAERESAAAIAFREGAQISPVPAPAVRMLTPEEPEKCYSLDEETFYDLGDLIDMLDEEQAKPGILVYEGESVRHKASHYARGAVANLFERMGEQAFDDAGEHIGDWPDHAVKDDNLAEFEKLIYDWLDANVKVHFYTVKNVRQIALTADMLGDDNAGRAIPPDGKIGSAA